MSLAPTALPDIIGPDLDVLFCGLNPGLTSAATGHSFANRSNRFWRAIHLAGFTQVQLKPEEDRTLLDYRCGLTTAAPRPTVSAGELSRSEFTTGAAALKAKIETYTPHYVAFLGKPAYAAITGQRQLSWGRQSDRFGGAQVWILPNPSGLNRAFQLDALVAAYRELHDALSR
ncbi:G/U mismatch-specific DNA glycosylase [Asticcacaulis sp.]|uniref:G/U mismatch-specific DNA glycosylase n=1 Tax=Asticcacaulis sp. TaxID=1872648 RepID=UPI002C1A9574|nr:G/U mismatch-specific DNA glycosylase [Asticcacaulis sp.]HTM81338.1 G/U mismatch-specific DNA glycosylase [Asticcacaulis sp.]